MNNNPWHKPTYARVSGYVEQSDIHSERTTVHEALMFSAALRMPPAVHRALRAAFVEEVRPQAPDLATVIAAANHAVPCLVRLGAGKEKLTGLPVKRATAADAVERMSWHGSTERGFAQVRTSSRSSAEL